MPKSKRSTKSDEDTRRKIEKYEKRLAKYRKRGQQLEDKNLISEPSIQIQEISFDPENILDDEDMPEVQEVDNMIFEHPEEQLDPDFLSALGESINSEAKYGEKIHEEIFNTIKVILTDGLSKENKDNFIESLLIPENCKLLDAPKLNRELVSMLNSSSKTRDELLQERQQDLGQAIGSICDVINNLARKDYNKLHITKKLSDVSRLLSNLHYQYTQIRRKLVNPFLDKDLSESLKENKREALLYSNLEESIKSFSAMKQASNALKPKTNNSNKLVSKNYHLPQRRNPKQAHPGPSRGMFRGGTQYRYQPQPRPPFKPRDNKLPSNRGRAKYP